MPPSFEMVRKKFRIQFQYDAVRKYTYTETKASKHAWFLSSVGVKLIKLIKLWYDISYSSPPYFEMTIIIVLIISKLSFVSVNEIEWNEILQ